MKVLSENCRFCLKILDSCDKFYEINDEIKRDFMDVTQQQLVASEFYIDVVCFLCLRSLQHASSLKKLLIENQKKFFKNYEFAAKVVEDDFEEPVKRGRPRKVKISQENTNDSIEPQQFLCKICSKPFKSKIRLRKHKITHSTERKMICTACGMKFKRSENLKAHMRLHDDPKLQCDLCARLFYEKGLVVYHMRSVHLNSRDYKCQYCTKSYYHLSNLKRHVLSSHENQKYYCGIESCGKSFNYKHHCKKHIIKMHRTVKFENIEELIQRRIANLPQQDENIQNS